MTESEILAMMEDLEVLPPLQDGDFTNQAIADRTGISYRAACIQAQKLVDDGVWKVVRKRDKFGHPVNTYTKARE